MLMYYFLLRIAKDAWDLGKDFVLMHIGEEGEIIGEFITGMKGGEGGSH